MTDKVVYLGNGTLNPVPVERVLQGAIDANLGHVLIIGTNEDGAIYLASSRDSRFEGTAADLLMLDRARTILMQPFTDGDIG